MEIEVTLSAIITVPDGSTLPDGEGRTIMLPNGDWVKPFLVLELNDDRDLTYRDLVAKGLDIEEASPVMDVLSNDDCPEQLEHTNKDT